MVSPSLHQLRVSLVLFTSIIDVIFLATSPSLQNQIKTEILVFIMFTDVLKVLFWGERTESLPQSWWQTDFNELMAAHLSQLLMQFFPLRLFIYVAITSIWPAEAFLASVDSLDLVFDSIQVHITHAIPTRCELATHAILHHSSWHENAMQFSDLWSFDSLIRSLCHCVLPASEPEDCDCSEHTQSHLGPDPHLLRSGNIWRPSSDWEEPSAHCGGAVRSRHLCEFSLCWYVLFYKQVCFMSNLLCVSRLVTGDVKSGPIYNLFRLRTANLVR